MPAVSQYDGHLVVAFQNQQVQSIASHYSIVNFQQAYPSSRLEHLKQVYFFTTTAPGFMDELQNNFPAVFMNGARYSESGMLVHTPNDWGKALGNEQRDLDLIKARNAWEITQGNPDIVLGLCDTWTPDHEDLNGKIIRRYPNPINRSKVQIHGMIVGGVMAGYTFNDTGLSSIGYKS